MTTDFHLLPVPRRWLAVFLIVLVAIVTSCGGSGEPDQEAQAVDESSTEVAVQPAPGPSLRAGDCFASAEDLAASRNHIDCGTPHTFEVFSFEEIAEDEFPGSDEIDAQAADVCEKKFRDAKGAPSAMSLVETLWAVPTESTWSEGDRFIACAVKYPSGTAQTFTEFDPLRAFGLVSIFGFAEGDCFQNIDLERTGARAIVCDVAHGFEVFAVDQIPDGEYPGDAAIEEQQNSFCSSQLSVFLGGSNAAAIPQVLFPDANTWDEGDRQISCLLFSDPMVEGSLRGTGDGSSAPTSANPAENGDAAGSAPADIDSDLVGGDLSVGNWISFDEMTSNQIALQWAGVANATSYELSRIDAAAAVGDDPATWSGAQSVYIGSELSFVDQTVNSGSEYIYFITATGADFTTNAQWRLGAAVDDTTGPSPVGSISALRTGGGLLLQWNESTDDFRFGVYEVFRGVGDAAPTFYGTVWRQDNTAWVDPAPPTSGDVTYLIFGIDLHGNESEPASLTYSFG